MCPAGNLGATKRFVEEGRIEDYIRIWDVYRPRDPVYETRFMSSKSVVGEFTYYKGSFVAAKAIENDYEAPVSIRTVLSPFTDQDGPVAALILHCYEQYIKLKWISSKCGSSYQEGTAGPCNVARNDAVSTESAIVVIQRLEKSGKIPATVQKPIVRDASILLMNSAADP